MFVMQITLERQRQILKERREAKEGKKPEVKKNANTEVDIYNKYDAKIKDAEKRNDNAEVAKIKKQALDYFESAGKIYADMAGNEKNLGEAAKKWEASGSYYGYAAEFVSKENEKKYYDLAFKSYGEAARLYEKTGQYRLAGQNYMVAGQEEKSADCFRKSAMQLEKAGNKLEAREDWGRVWVYYDTKDQKGELSPKEKEEMNDILNNKLKQRK